MGICLSKVMGGKHARLVAKGFSQVTDGLDFENSKKGAAERKRFGAGRYKGNATPTLLRQSVTSGWER